MGGSTIPGPDGVTANSPTRVRNPLEYRTEIAREYGPLARLGPGPEADCLVSGAAEAQTVLTDEATAYSKGPTGTLGHATGDGLLVSEDETWQQSRPPVSSALSPQLFQNTLNSLGAHCRDNVCRWDGERRRSHPEMEALTAWFLVSSLTGTDDHGIDVSELTAAVRTIHAHFHPQHLLLPDSVSPASKCAFEQACAAVERVTDQIMELVTANGINETYESSLVAQLAGSLPSAQLRDEVRTILVAGFESTAVLVAYTLFLLAQSPTAQSRVRDEITSCQDEAVTDLTYLDVVIREAARLYPPVHSIPRVTEQPVTIGDWHLPKDTFLIISQWTIHRSSNHYRQPASFNPERWLADNQQSEALFPFGGGPRACIGASLAMHEAKTLVSTVVQHSTFTTPCDDLTLYPGLTLTPVSGVPLDFSVVN